MQLQEEISDLENKLAAVRRYFNSATKRVEQRSRDIPVNLIAGMFGFKKEVMFDLGEQRATLKKHLKSSSVDAHVGILNPTEQEQFPVPAPALLVSLPGNGISFFAFLPPLHLLAMNDDGSMKAELSGYSTGMFIHLAPYVLGGVLWFTIAYFANTHHQLGKPARTFVENGNKRVYKLVEKPA